MKMFKKRALLLCLSVIIIAGLAVGGTLAYMKESSGAVTNTFVSGKITYTLNLEANAKFADKKYEDTDVAMPEELTPKEGKEKSVVFTLDKNPELTGYTFLGWYYDAECTKPYNGVNEKAITVKYGDSHDRDIRPNKVEITLYAKWGVKSYVIRYNANGGEGTMANQGIEYNKPTALSKNIFTKSDYSFGGWATEPGGEVVYNDEQIVVNLLEEGTLDLYAVWIQNSHTVTFDYNGGYGTPESKQVQNGKAYGVLPTYPIHPTEAVSETEIMSYLFTGWYTAPTGGTRVYPSTIVNSTEDHVLYAQWKEAPTNNIIQDLVVKNNPDDNGDGVVDSFYVNLKCSSYFEKMNIPLENLIPGQKYRLSFTESNNATYGMNEKGYGGAIYGFIITTDKTLTAGSIKNESIADGGLIKQFSDRNDGALNGPRNWETTFTAEAGTMYWTWDYGLIQDGYNRDYNYTNIRLELIEPEIEFGQKKLIIHNTSDAKVVNDSSTEYSNSFTFDGAGYAETLYYPITGLTAGTTYTITFDHKFTGALINSGTYDYGCGIMTAAPEKYGSKMSNLGTWASNTFVMSSVTGNTESVTLTFTATGDTAYWVWNMANVSDSVNGTVDIRVTNFSARKGSGTTVTYYSSASRGIAVKFMKPPAAEELQDAVEISGEEELQDEEKTEDVTVDAGDIDVVSDEEIPQEDVELPVQEDPSEPAEPVEDPVISEGGAS